LKTRHLSDILWRSSTFVTRWLQATQSQRSLRGLRRVCDLLGRVLPPYEGVVRLPGGVSLNVDTRVSAERWLLCAGVYHPALAGELKRHTPEGAYCLDVGANLGFFALHFAHWAGPLGKVAAFEANPDLVQRIAANVAANGFDNVTIIEKAAHDRQDVLEFYIASDPGKSSLEQAQVKRPARVVQVEAISIDAFIEQERWPRVDAIKIDVEGNDCRVVCGARETLRRFRPFVAFEYKFDTPPELANQVFDLLTECGYRLQALTYDGRRFPFDRDHLPAGYTQADILCFPS